MRISTSPTSWQGVAYYVPGDQGYEATISARMEPRALAREAKPRRKQRATPPMASMSDGLRPREANRKMLADRKGGAG